MASPGVAQHTHIGVYAVGLFCLLCTFGDSVHGFLERYHINRKWFYLYGEQPPRGRLTAAAAAAAGRSSAAARRRGG
jgi:hypothetical protein